MVDIQTREPQTADDERGDRRRRLTWVMTFTAAAAASIVVIFVLTGLFADEANQVETVDDPETDEPLPTVVDEAPGPTSAPVDDEVVDATTDETLDLVVAENLAVATAFMDAYGHGDFDAASQYLVQTESGSAEAVIWTGFAQSYTLLEYQIEWMRAVDWRVDGNACTVDDPDPANTFIDCQFLNDTAWGRALGLEPYPATFRFRVHRSEGLSVFGDLEDPAITQMTDEDRSWETFLSEVMDPFMAWLEANHPDDVDSMFIAANPAVPTPILPKVWPETRTLWAQYTEEFVAEHG